MAKKQVASLVEELMNRTKEEILSSIEEQILDHISSLKAGAVIKIQINEVVKETKLSKPLHYQFEEVLKLITINKNLLMVGEAGVGKTTLASDIAEALDLPFGHLNCTSGLSEGWIIGRPTIDGNYIQTDFISIFENGGVFLFDEADASDPNLLMLINTAIGNGRIAVPFRKEKPLAERHNDTYIIFSANTFGFGSSKYVGRNILDSATLDRFALSKIIINYDKKLEKLLIEDEELFEFFTKVRNKIVEHKINRSVSTRAFAQAGNLLKSGFTRDKIKEIFFLGWTKEEIEKVTK